MAIYLKLKLKHTIYLFACLSLMASCNTGIERTKRITPTRADRLIMRESAEEALADSVHPAQLSQWMPGKEFVVTNSRASLLYDITDRSGRRTHQDSIQDMTVRYIGTDAAVAPDGRNISVVKFDIPSLDRFMTYTVRKDPAATGSMVWSDFPMLIDLDMVSEFSRMLTGRKVWLRTALWYDNDMNPVKGRKFIPVTIGQVKRGNSSFPLLICFDDGKDKAWLPMNMPDGKGNQGSRNFASLFYISDPKLRFPDIAPEVWDLICSGQVQPGMTKQECKLALGNPDQVETGHDWNILADIWKYSDGRYLFFIDDKLVDNKR